MLMGILILRLKEVINLLDITISEIQHEYIDDVFNQLKVSFVVFKDGVRIKNGKRYIQEDLSYQEIVDFIKSKEEEKPIRTFTKVLSDVQEIESVTEIIEEEELQ